MLAQRSSLAAVIFFLFVKVKRIRSISAEVVFFFALLLIVDVRLTKFDECVRMKEEDKIH